VDRTGGEVIAFGPATPATPCAEPPSVREARGKRSRSASDYLDHAIADGLVGGLTWMGKGTLEEWHQATLATGTLPAADDQATARLGREDDAGLDGWRARQRLEGRAALGRFVDLSGQGSLLLGVRHHCRRLLLQSGYRGGRVDLGDVVRRAGGVVEERDLYGDEGSLTVGAAGWVIRVCQGPGDPLAQPPRRFTIAHEVGHILLFEGVVDAGPGWVRALMRGAGPEVEDACELAARELLMPWDDFQGRRRLGSLQAAQVVDLAQFYGVAPLDLLTRFGDAGRVRHEVGGGVAARLARPTRRRRALAVGAFGTL
jgi:hypothetical protein